MPQTDGTNFANLVAVPPVRIRVNQWNGRVRMQLEKITMAAQASADTIRVARLPNKCVPIQFGLNPSATLGSSTVAIGNATTAGKYRAAATLTVADAWSFSAVNAAVGEELTADEDVLLTIGAAALPGSGTLRHVAQYMID